MKYHLPDDAEQVDVSLTRFDVFCIGAAFGMMALVGIIYLIPLV